MAANGTSDSAMPMRPRLIRFGVIAPLPPWPNAYDKLPAAFRNLDRETAFVAPDPLQRAVRPLNIATASAAASP
jgi:hypothetical protein